MGQPAAPRALVPARAVAPSSLACQAPAWPAAVAVATVAVAAQHDLGAAACAQEQAGGCIHAHLGPTEVLDGRVPGRQTAVAPPSSARCRARYGRRASRQERPLPRPPASAWALLYRERHRQRRPVLAAQLPKPLPRPDRRPPRRRLADAFVRAWLAALQGGQPGEHQPTRHQVDQHRIKSATSPANSVGS